MKRLSDRGARAIAIGLVVLTAVLAGGVALWRVLRPRQPHVEVDYARYPVRGLDISAHNGAPDFDSIAAAGIDFAHFMELIHGVRGQRVCLAQGQRGPYA